MGIFALIKDGVVENTIVADELQIVQIFFPEHLVVEQVESTGHAYIGGQYVDKQFRPVKQFESWSWSSENKDWQAPKPRPEVEGKFFIWDEESLDWVEPVVVEVTAE